MSAAIFCSGPGRLITARLLSARTMRTPVCPTGTLNRDRFLFPATYILSVCLLVSVLLPHPATHPSCMQTCCSPAAKTTCLDLIGGGDAHCAAKVASFPWVSRQSQVNALLVIPFSSFLFFFFSNKVLNGQMPVREEADKTTKYFLPLFVCKTKHLSLVW